MVLNILLAIKMVKNVKPLCAIFLKLITNRKDFDDSNYMSFLIKNDILLLACFHEKYLRTDGKSYEKKSAQNFYDNKI